MSENPPVTWSWHTLQSLSSVELHAVLSARSAVFVVEQTSIYQDPDTIDLEAWHLLGRAPDGALLAYARVTPPGSRFDEPSIGRVLTLPAARGLGLGRDIVARAVAKCIDAYAGMAIRISAQTYLIDFYGDFGFVSDGAVYDEDGIPHIEMVRAAD